MNRTAFDRGTGNREPGTGEPEIALLLGALLLALCLPTPGLAQTTSSTTSAAPDAGVRRPFRAAPPRPAADRPPLDASAPDAFAPDAFAPDAAPAAPPPPPEPPAPPIRARPAPSPPTPRLAPARGPKGDGDDARPDAGVALDARPAAAAEAPPSVEPGPAPSSGWTFWDVGPPASRTEEPSTFDRLAERLDRAVWPVLQVLFGVFVFLRLLSWLVRRLAKGGRPTFVLLRRGWVFVEGTAWLLTVGWAVFELSARQNPSATLLALVALAVLVALSWNGLRDVAAGLMLAAERPFGLGDYVHLAEGEGRVRAFRSRVLELEAPDGLRIRVPYPRVLGATRIRKGGRQTAHAVQVELEVPESMEPQDALRAAHELAASSPWSVLGEVPRLELCEEPGGPRVRLVAFAFDAEAEPLLYADVLSGWRDMARRG